MCHAIYAGVIIDASKRRKLTLWLLPVCGRKNWWRTLMLKTLFRFSMLVGFFSLATRAAIAQEIVHALTGTVGSIDTGAKTITVVTDDGSDGTFHILTDPHASMKFEKSMRNDATAAGEFKQKGAHVVVYYFGAGGRTAVALKPLGPGPFKTTSGTVVKFEKKEHSLTITDQTGATQSFDVTPSTIAETDAGATEGLKFDPRKGEKVIVSSTQANGASTAVFINGALGL
jgi:hypothetical protein